MKNMIQAAVVTLFAASAAHAQQAVQWKVSDGGNGHWYLPITTAVARPQALLQAAALGGHLATITSSAENQFLASLNLPSLDGAISYWTGGVRADSGYGPWSWITGEAWDYSNFDASEPNGCCGADVRFTTFRSYVGHQGKWDDTSYENAQFVLVEFDADCNHDGVADYGQILDGTLADTNTNGIPDICETRQVAPYHRTLSIADQANIRAQNWNCPGFSNGGLYPLGSAIYAGTPFEHGPAGQYAFMGGNYCGDSPRSLAVNVSAPGTATIRILLNSWNGCNSGPDFLATVTFADGTSRSWTLVNGIDYRDHNGTCPLLGTRSQEVWSSGQNQRIDMLTLPIERPGATTTGVRIESTDPASQIAAPFVFGITVSDSEDCNGDGIADWGQCLNGTLPDRNGNGIPDICEGPTCVDADLFRDFNVNGADLGILLSQWGPNTALTVSDLNKDGFVNGADLGIMLSFWGACPN